MSNSTRNQFDSKSTDLKSLASDVVKSRHAFWRFRRGVRRPRRRRIFSRCAAWPGRDAQRIGFARSIGSARFLWTTLSLVPIPATSPRAGIDRLLSSALELAKITSEDPFSGIPEAAKLGSISGPLDLYHEDVYSLPGAERIDYARRAEKAALIPTRGSRTPMVDRSSCNWAQDSRQLAWLCRRVSAFVLLGRRRSYRAR